MSYTDTPPPYGLATPRDDLLTRGVLLRRCLAWLVDVFLIGCLMAVAWVVLFTFGMLTLGLGMPLLGLLSLLPFCYNFLFLAGMAATPGQALCGLRVLRDDDLGRPTPLQALLSTLVYYLTLATTGLLLLAALVTARHRTLHDLVSGLVAVRAQALTRFAGSWNMQGGSPHA